MRECGARGRRGRGARRGAIQVVNKNKNSKIIEMEKGFGWLEGAE